MRPTRTIVLALLLPNMVVFARQPLRGIANDTTFASSKRQLRVIPTGKQSNDTVTVYRRSFNSRKLLERYRVHW